MSHLTVEVHILSTQDEVSISNHFTSLYKYYSKNYKRTNYVDSKIFFAEGRDVISLPESQTKQKINLKDLETNLKKNKMASFKWLRRDTIEIMLSDLHRYLLQINPYTGDVLGVKRDPVLCKRINASSSQDSFQNSNNLEILVSTNNLSITKDHQTTSPSFSNKSLSTDNSGTNQGLALHPEQPLVVAWFAESSSNHRISIYQLISDRLELLATGSSQHYVIKMQFSIKSSGEVKSIEVSNELVHLIYYQVLSQQMKEFKRAEVMVKGVVVGCDWSNDENRAAVITNERKLVCCHLKSNLARSCSTLVEGTDVTWYRDAMIIVVGTYGDVQFFDVGLNALKVLYNGDLCSLVQLSLVLRERKVEFVSLNTRAEYDNDKVKEEILLEVSDILSIFFHGSPLVSLLLLPGIHTYRGFSSLHIIQNHLRYHQHKQALSLLLALEWQDGDQQLVYRCLAAVVTYLLRRDVLNDDIINDIESALGKYFSQANHDTFPEVHRPIENLAKRYFNVLLRNKHYEKCYLLALDLKSPQLFMNLSLEASDESVLVDTCRRMLEDHASLFSLPDGDDNDSLRSLTSMDSLVSSCYDEEEEEEEDEDAIVINENQAHLHLSRFISQHINSQLHHRNNHNNINNNNKNIVNNNNENNNKNKF